MTVAISVTVCNQTAKLSEPPASGAAGATSFVDAKQIACSYVLTQGFGGFFVRAGQCVSHKKDDKTAARSDSQASQTKAAVGLEAAEDEWNEVEFVRAIVE